jgi:hypothetical protein
MHRAEHGEAKQTAAAITAEAAEAEDTTEPHEQLVGCRASRVWKYAVLPCWVAVLWPMPRVKSLAASAAACLSTSSHLEPQRGKGEGGAWLPTEHSCSPEGVLGKMHGREDPAEQWWWGWRH